MLWYADLVRIRLSAAVTLSAATGFFLHSAQCNRTFLIMTTGVFLLATGASACNQVTERLRDALMNRTMDRPLPKGRIKVTQAAAISWVHMMFGVVLLVLTGWVPAFLGVGNVLMYNIAYTHLKPRSFLAILPGSLVGAIPPLIGYTAAGGDFLAPNILTFAGFMFLWQIPHFWIIMVKYRSEYETAGFKTFPFGITDRYVHRVIFLWAILTTLLLTLSMQTWGWLNPQIAILALPLNIFFIIAFYRTLNRKKHSKAFVMINVFGLLVMLVLILNAWL
jgi:protoheme IX farnesyltransferase